MKVKPAIGITMGDAAGIGPEIIVKSLKEEAIYQLCVPVVIGCGAMMRWAGQQFWPQAEIRHISSVSEARGQFGTIEILDMPNLKVEDVAIGEVCATSGKAAMEYVIAAMQLAQEGSIKAIVTAPLNKEATTLAGYTDLGHMELFARLTGTKQLATMLVSGPLRVVHLTTHKSLREACQLVSKDLILNRLRLTQQCFENWGMAQPRIGVAALNPHAGEGGLLGDEEIKQIIPAVKAAQQLGIDAQGPIPADIIFTQAINGKFDVVLAMYHDQGHIPIKTFGFEKSVSVALGLPFTRTSVDHGTALDIAGKGIAQAESMIEAIKVAVQLVTAGKL